jgi:hypothetical protein
MVRTLRIRRLYPLPLETDIFSQVNRVKEDKLIVFIKQQTPG